MNRLGKYYLMASVAGALAAAPAIAEDPKKMPDNSWISVSGTVESVTADSFILDYGDGRITVEMDDGDRDADGYKLLEGDMVTVNGMIDADFFEAKTIEASSVYVDNIDTYFYASAVDEEDTFVTVTTPVVVAATVVQGEVTEVSDDEFMLDTGARRIEVEVDALADNPLDDEGYQKIEVGDRVSVAGSMDDDLFEGRELVATSVVTLSRAGS